MKKQFIYLFKYFAFLLWSVAAAQAQIPTIQINGTQTFTSISNVDGSGNPIPEVNIHDLFLVDIKAVYLIYNKTNQILSNYYGIDATFTTSANNPTSPQITEPVVSSVPSIVVVKVYGYDKTKLGGKGNLIFGIYSTQTTTSGNFTSNGWTINTNTYTDYLSNLLSFGKNLLAPTFKSTNMKIGSAMAKKYFTDNPDCQYISSTTRWGLWSYKSYDMPKNADGSINTDCFLTRSKSALHPVIIEVTVKNATLRAIKIPGIGIINTQWFPVQNPAATATVEIKGSNYEINTLQNELTFGHSATAITGKQVQNRFTVTNVNTTFSGAKFTGLYGSGGSTDAYMKIKVTAGQEFYAAVTSSQINWNGALGTPAQATLILNNAFQIKDAVDGSNRTFNIWKITAATTDRTFKFPVNREGPFIIANAFDANFKENLALPANKRKLFHRANWLNDVLVCAHRGLWNQTGQPGNGSDIPQQLNGIAENTIDAYEAAINNSGVDWIEFDARRTSDGVFVAWHDPDIWRISNKFDDRECIPLEELNQRDRIYTDQYPTWKKPVSQYSWSELQNLQLRDYLGCKVKVSNGTGNYVNPLKLTDAFQWVVDKAAQGKYTVLSIDFKDGLKYLHELYRLILEKDLEGQVLFSVYAREYSLADYQKEYGSSFLRQIPLKPTFYEPTNPETQYGGDLPQRLNEYVQASNNGHFVAALTINVNNDSEPTLTNLLRQTNPPAYPADKIWYVSHYLEPYMVSIYDNLRVNTPADCDPTQHPGTQVCVNLFWRADFDWLLNNGTNGIFSDNPVPLINYLIAKGKKQP